MGALWDAELFSASLSSIPDQGSPGRAAALFLPITQARRGARAGSPSAESWTLQDLRGTGAALHCLPPSSGTAGPLAGREAAY